MFFGTTDLCSDRDCIYCQENWTHTPSVAGSYSRPYIDALGNVYLGIWVQTNSTHCWLLYDNYKAISNWVLIRFCIFYCNPDILLLAMISNNSKFSICNNSVGKYVTTVTYPSDSFLPFKLLFRYIYIYI